MSCSKSSRLWTVLTSASASIRSTRSGALEGPDVVVDTLAPHVVNLHVKDFDVVRFEPHKDWVLRLPERLRVRASSTCRGY